MILYFGNRFFKFVLFYLLNFVSVEIIFIIFIKSFYLSFKNSSNISLWFCLFWSAAFTFLVSCSWFCSYLNLSFILITNLFLVVNVFYFLFSHFIQTFLVVDLIFRIFQTNISFINLTACLFFTLAICVSLFLLCFEVVFYLRFEDKLYSLLSCFLDLLFCSLFKLFKSLIFLFFIAKLSFSQSNSQNFIKFFFCIFFPFLCTLWNFFFPFVGLILQSNFVVV